MCRERRQEMTEEVDGARERLRQAQHHAGGGPLPLPRRPRFRACPRARSRGGGQSRLARRGQGGARGEAPRRGGGRPEPARWGRDEADRGAASVEPRGQGRCAKRDRKCRGRRGGAKGGGRRGPGQGEILLDHRRGGEAPGRPLASGPQEHEQREPELLRITLPRTPLNKVDWEPVPIGYKTSVCWASRCRSRL